MAILWMGVAALIGWPFIVFLAVPMAVDCIWTMGLGAFCGWTLLFGLSLCTLSVAIDFVFYGKVLLAPFNIFLYNLAITGGDEEGGDRAEGQNLYGTEHWIYYVKNLVFNWNIVYLLAFSAPMLCHVAALVFCHKKKRMLSVVAVRLLHCMLPLWTWYLLFSYMPHKEERFMFVIYPFLALNASLSLTQCRLIKLGDDGVTVMGVHVLRKDTARFVASNFNFGVVLAFIVLSLSRTAGQVENPLISMDFIFLFILIGCHFSKCTYFVIFRGSKLWNHSNPCTVHKVMYYRAPLDIWHRAGEYIRAERGHLEGVRDSICVGKEWHRIPSSLLVSDVARIQWIDAGFDGQLPAEFVGTNTVHRPFNDRNEGDKSRFVPAEEVDSACDYIIDLWEADTVITEYEVNRYEKIFSAQFLDRAATGSGIFRSFYIPLLSDSKVKFASYVFLKRKDSERTDSERIQKHS